MMPTPTISLAATTHSVSNNNNTATTNANNKNNNNEKINQVITPNNHLDSIIISTSNDNTNGFCYPKSVMAKSSIVSNIDPTNSDQISNNDHQSRLRRHMTEEMNEDSIYNVYLKKITYTCNNILNKQQKLQSDNFITRCDQVDYSSSKNLKKNGNNKMNHNQQQDDQQSLQWETRQLRQIKAATMEHLVQFILLQTEYQQQQHNNYNESKSSQQHHNDHSDSDEESQLESSDLMEERNNVAHVMHVLFATYRQFYYPWQLFTEIIRQKPFVSTKQFNFILFYWLNNYPEDFWTPCQPSMANSNTNYIDDQASSHNNNGSPENGNQLLDDQSSLCSEYASSSSLSSNHASYTTPSLSLSSTSNNVSNNSSLSSTSISSSRFSPLTLADQLISLRHIDEEVKKHCLHLLDMKKENTTNSSTLNSHSSIHKSVNKSSSIIELDPKFVAQQLTAIDLENFLALKPYTLLSNVRSKTRIETMIRNFNLLSRHVIITILQHSTPHQVTIHWIEIAHHLRKMRNFNSLKAIIAGLTNESIYRLKTTVWNKLPRNSITTFQNMSSIVDDVNNQTMLRHTQLFIEGTSKVSLEDSFGTVPYLGTFLTDITMINTRYENYIKTEKGKKLINFEKCAKQYEILMQMQLLQKNAIAGLQQQQQQNYQHQIYSLNHYLSLRSQSVPSIPRVARIFRNWFQLNESDLPSDREW
ncbi:Ral guanine nucleotide dissociation stimulator-like 1 [Dermatophagoides pteronyssinus]|uniref:Ral guanine nucleotide dissociation stimulator-like 1 n=1 Tax=Dermatophagoides pteronyssinus TaxID=6956 RepID=A0ABQ8IZQ5_DERPT|nr:Ral guanine nucleotide dissociation stimulator-like 1 [Dermatophagoides pteronyssinus]